MRWILLCLCCFCTVFARADGALRLLYTGNLATGSTEQREEIRAQLTAWQAESEQAKVPYLVMSPGNILTPVQVDSPGDSDALAFLHSFNPAAVGLGPNEVWHGAELLARYTKATPLPWTSLNVELRKVPSDDMRTIKAGALKVGVVGLSLSANDMPDKILREGLKKNIDRLQRKCDLVVLLGPFNGAQATILSAYYDKADVVLGATGKTAILEFGETILAPISDQIPYCGMLDLTTKDGRMATWRGTFVTATPTPEPKE